MENLYVPVPLAFAIGETYSPPAFLWNVVTPGCPPTCAPMNLTGFEATFTAKQSAQSQLPPDILATTENGMLVINGPAGSIQLVLPSWYTAEISPFEGYWDLWVFSPPYSTQQTRLYGGKIEVFLAVGSP